jgi:TolA protein
MKKPATISIGLHAAILFAALVGFSAPKPFEVKPLEAIQVDISTITDKTQQMATAKDATPKPDKPAPKPTKIVKDVPSQPKVADEVKTAAHEPVKPPDPTPPEPKPDPTPPEPKVPPPDPKALTDLLKKTEPPKEEPKPVDDTAMKKLLAEQQAADDQKKAEEQKKADDLKKKTEAKKKADEKKKRAEQLAAAEAALLNKIQGESTAPAKPSKEEGAPKQAAKDNQGNDAAMTATIIDALVSKVKGCMNVPPAAREANIAVRIHFLLNPDGSVNGQPEVQSMNSDPIFDATARAAVSAILECQNYELPKDQYDLWKDNTLDFNPNLLFGT